MKKYTEPEEDFCIIEINKHYNKKNKIITILIICSLLVFVMGYIKKKDNKTMSSVLNEKTNNSLVEKKVDMDILNSKYYVSLDENINWIVDLDGDGSDEKICYKTKESTDENDENDIMCYLYIDNELVLSEEFYNGCKETFSIVDLSKDDKNLEIELDTFDDVGLGRVYSNFYRWTDKVMYPIGSDYNVLSEDELLNIDGISGMCEYSTEIQCLTNILYWEKCKYDSEKHIFNYIPQDEYDISFPDSLELYTDLNVYKDSDEKSTKTLMKAQKVNFKKYKKDKDNNGEWFYLKGDDGTEGWIVVRADLTEEQQQINSEMYPGGGYNSVNGDLSSKYFRVMCAN